jgi:PAS domain S-box-containing protein
MRASLVRDCGPDERPPATNESAMNRKELLAEAVLSSSSDAIIAADRDGTIFFWNPGAERIFGYTNAEAIGRSLDIIIPDRLRKRHWDGYNQVMNGRESRYDHGDVLAVPGIGKCGGRISLEFTIVPLRTEAGELMGLAAVMRDVTKSYNEKRTLKQQLVEATKAMR